MEVDIAMSDNRMTRICIATDFSRYPAGRYPEDGPFNGTTFRQDHLVPALQNFDTVRVIFDGVAGFASSFLEEAFGGLVRYENMDKNFLDKRLVILTSEPNLEDDVFLANRHIKNSVEEKR